MKTIVHTCSSILVRPNGIVRYINAVMDLQRAQGHRVIFVTDARPTQLIKSDETIYINDTSNYKPNWRDGHVWLQVDRNVSHDVEMAFRRLDVEPDLVIAHDLHSYLGAVNEFDDGIFVQHESDVMNNDGRYSFLDDDYLQTQINIGNETTWRIGMCAPYSWNITPRRPVYTPPPTQLESQVIGKPTRGLLYIGDTTERKGAREFMDMARRLGVRPTVITHDVGSDIFDGADVHTFALDQRAQMFQLISECAVAFVPSKNECFSLAIIECAQFVPTVVDSQYQWTDHLWPLGVESATGEELYALLDDRLKSTKPYNRRLLEAWAAQSMRFWQNLST